MLKRVDELKVHPSAARYPMLPPDELAELADDIAQHGLIHPIALDPAGVLLDGRNRLAACKIAGVKPEFITINGQTDPIAFIHSANDHRRHMNAGQRAMAVAFDYPEPEKGGRGKKGAAGKAEETSGFSAKRVNQARAVLRHSPALAEAVLNGGEKLDAILRQVEQEQQALKSKEARRVSLQTEAPDLSKLVDDDSLSLEAAEAALKEREAQEKNQRETIFRALKYGIEGLALLAFEPAVAELVGKHPKEFAQINPLGTDYLSERAGYFEGGVAVLRAALMQLGFAGGSDEPQKQG